MKGQDFNGGVGIGGIVKILMEGRGLRLPEIEMFSEYVGETRKFVRERRAENPVKMQINLQTPYDSEYLYKNSDGQVICSVRKYLVRDGSGAPILDTHTVNQRKSSGNSLVTTHIHVCLMSDRCIISRTYWLRIQSSG